MRRRRPIDPVCPASADVLTLGRVAGLDAVGVAPASPMLRARLALEGRKAAGLHAGMSFTYKNPERSTDPGRAVAGAAAVVVGARRYQLESPSLISSIGVSGESPGPTAAIARYAWIDHYAPLRDSLKVVSTSLREQGWKTVVLADDNSIVDREIAWLAGIGWFGKNANLLLPGAGSWFVLGCVVTNAPLTVNDTPMADGCGGCRRCLDGCPTGAIIAPGVVDGHRCLAWLLQKPGIFPIEYRAALGGRIYGCDDCQEVCPPNVRFGRTRESVAQVVDRLSVLNLLTLDDQELLDLVGRWYIHDRQPRWVRRNALVVLGNSGDGHDARTVQLMSRYLADADPMLRAHATWTARRLGRDDMLPIDDDDPMVHVERERELDIVAPQ